MTYVMILLMDGVDVPDFKMSRNANNLCGGRLRDDANKRQMVEGWGLCDMNVSPENKRWHDYRS